jgi:MFS family permease
VTTDETERLGPEPPVPPPPGRRRVRTGLRSLAMDLTPLRRHRDFRLLFLGRGISFFGTMITFVAVPYQLYEITGSSLAVGIVGALELAGILLLAFVGGALADAVDRRRMVQVSEGLLTLCSTLLLLNATVWEPQLWLLYLIAFASAAAEALQRPSLEGLVPRLVDKDELAAASALSSFRMTVGALAGPALAGVVIAELGLGAAYALDIATFVVSLVLLTRMRAVPPPPEAEPPSLARVLEGLRYARSRQELVGTYVVDIVAMFFGMPMALFPAIADDLGGASTLGLLYSAPAAGSMLATVTSGWTGRVQRHGLAVIVAATAWGLAIVGFGLAPTTWVAVLFLAVAGGADMISGIFRMVIWNRTPDHIRGRLASIEMLSYTSGPTLGHVESGVAAALFSVRVSVVSGGVLCVAGVALTAALLPAFVRYRPPADEPAGPADPTEPAEGTTSTSAGAEASFAET